MDVVVAGDQLRTIIERIGHVESEIKELTEKEIYLETEGNGFDVRILRDVIRRRNQAGGERDEQEGLIDLYLQAVQEGSAAIKRPTAASWIGGVQSGAGPPDP